MALLAMAAVTFTNAADPLVYVGTYTRNTSQGIYAFRLNEAGGRLTPLGLAAEATNPSFVAIHPSGKFLYAVSEVGGSGGLTAFRIDRDSGKLEKLNAIQTKGAGPCHVAVDRTGKMAVVAHYGSGSVAAAPIKPDGSLGEVAGFVQHTGSSVDKKRQSGPHAHSVNFSPDNRFVIAADLGLDRLLVYAVDPATAGLKPHDPPYATVPAGGGPRHFNFHPNGRFAYAINEMASTVTAFRWDAKAGVLHPGETVSTLPKDFGGNNSTAEILVHPNGRFVYGSNRGHDSIGIFKISGPTGALSLTGNTLTQGKTPRNFGIDPTGRYLIAANQDSGTLVVFRIDASTGGLTPTGQVEEVGAPVCVRFVK
jgi:6-phosphogluconolactonase